MKFSFENQPKFAILSNSQIRLIHEKALHLLESTGVNFQSQEALNILEACGAGVDWENNVVRFPPEMVLDAISKAPASLQLFNREGEPVVDVSGDNFYFVPGSSAIKFMESNGTVRQSESRDLKALSRVNDYLENIQLQSSALVLYDVPKLIGDSYRLYLLLKNSPKPVITGAFGIQGVHDMHKMLSVVAGGADALRDKPMAIFDICPMSSLQWTNESSQNIIDCASYGLPIETVSMPMPGAATPATLSGSLLVHTMESLSGLVLAQCVSSGTPVIYGGAPVHFDMRTGTTPLSAIEATMIAAAYAQLGRYYGLPTHTYACLSDSKIVDAQAGLETAMSGIVALLAGVNIISGPGILEFVTCISLEKLIIDNEICGMARRLHEGLNTSPDALAADLIAELGPGGDYISTEHTFRWFKEEPYIPSSVINRSNRSSWEAEGCKEIFTRAREKVQEILKTHQPRPMEKEKAEALDRVYNAVMSEHNISTLPFGPR